MEFAENRDFQTVTLVDRTGLGGTEIIYDGVRIVFPKGTTEKAIPRFVAAWLFRVSQQMVWTDAREFVNRFGIKDLPSDLEAELGPEAGNTSPIVIDGTRVEGWDTAGVERQDTRTIELKMPRALLQERQGASTASFAERKG